MDGSQTARCSSLPSNLTFNLYCGVTRSFEIESQPERVAEIPRPVKPAHRSRKIVVVKQGRRLAKHCKIILRDLLKQVKNVARSAGAPASRNAIQHLGSVEPHFLSGDMGLQSRRRQTQRATGL